MGYCTEKDIRNVIAQALTSATASTDSSLNTYASLLNVGKTLDKNLVTTGIIESYIQMTDTEIDASLSQLYSVPFCQIANFETILYSEIDEYNHYLVVERSCPFSPGDIIILKYQEHEETLEIEELIEPTIFSTVDDVQYHFPADSRLVRVSYPSPIRYISARLAAANIYDKYFSAEVSPGTSAYGQYIREIARQEINNILNGRTILHGVHRIGRRFYNANLVEQYDLPKGSDGSKDIDALSKG